jgi:hypothetical protein
VTLYVVKTSVVSLKARLVDSAALFYKPDYHITPARASKSPRDPSIKARSRSGCHTMVKSSSNDKGDRQRSPIYTHSSPADLTSVTAAMIPLIRCLPTMIACSLQGKNCFLSWRTGTRRMPTSSELSHYLSLLASPEHKRSTSASETTTFRPRVRRNAGLNRSPCKRCKPVVSATQCQLPATIRQDPI